MFLQEIQYFNVSTNTAEQNFNWSDSFYIVVPSPLAQAHFRFTVIIFHCKMLQIMKTYGKEDNLHMFFFNLLHVCTGFLNKEF